jgi:hypothetical protein
MEEMTWSIREKEAIPMGVLERSELSSGRYGVTLEDLKQRRYSLNMRLLLSMQNHDEKMQGDLERQLNELQSQIDAVLAGDRNI